MFSKIGSCSLELFQSMRFNHHAAFIDETELPSTALLHWFWFRVQMRSWSTIIWKSSEIGPNSCWRPRIYDLLTEPLLDVYTFIVKWASWLGVKWFIRQRWLVFTKLTLGSQSSLILRSLYSQLLFYHLTPRKTCRLLQLLLLVLINFLWLL
jgi:hypothetical protein